MYGGCLLCPLYPLLIKHKIRQRTITYRKAKARERREELQKVKEKLEECTEKCDIDPNSRNLEKLECLHTEYDQFYDHITQGAIICSRLTWYKMDEKKNFFWSLENSIKTKRSGHKILTRAGVLTSDTKKIKNELELYYSNLYDGKNLCRHADYFLVYK